MRSLVLASALMLSATSSAAADTPKQILPNPMTGAFEQLPAHCPSLAGHPTARPGEPLKPRKLAELPPAQAYHAVFRRGADGCIDPLFVGYQYRTKR